ncbi:MAG: hypothetical protein WA173_22005, partial [Pseudomonas sp.]|uniref:hypothetical protein n=1 Tax=Pseudomonas sp. TaxID=306 RepID=UPI003BB5A7DA
RCYLKSAGVWLSKQALNLRRSAIFAPIQAIKPARKRFYTASAKSSPSKLSTKQGAIHIVDLGKPELIKNVFVGFQKYLYQSSAVQ